MKNAKNGQFGDFSKIDRFCYCRFWKLILFLFIGIFAPKIFLNSLKKLARKSQKLITFLNFRAKIQN